MASPLPVSEPSCSRLTGARRAAGLTLTELARAVHVTRPTVSLWERGGRRPAREYWAALAESLGIGTEAVADLFVGYPPGRFDTVRLPGLSLARRSAGVTQRELAARVGVAPTTLAMWETSGVPVPACTVPALVDVLGVPPERLRAEPPAAREDPRPLRSLRRRAGMSQREAAAHLGIAVGSLARYESGERTPPVRVIHRMAAAYGVPVGAVLPHCGLTLQPVPPGASWRPDDVPVAVRALRTAAGMGKEQLGRAMGVSGRTVHGWESGRRLPRPADCRRLEVVFGLRPGRFPG